MFEPTGDVLVILIDMPKTAFLFIYLLIKSCTSLAA